MSDFDGRLFLLIEELPDGIIAGPPGAVAEVRHRRAERLAPLCP